MNISIPTFHELKRSSSSSETSFPTTPVASPHSDEEVILASTRPKKRSGRRVFKETRHPVYRGVRARDNNKWVCEMRVPNTINSKIWLGTYPTPQMAARAHDVASLALRGKSACLNFADSAWRLKLPESTDAVEIRKAAMKAAELIAAEDKSNNNQQCYSSDDQVVIRMEDEENNNKQQQDTCLETESEDFHDLLLSIALMSPPHSARDYGIEDWADMDIFETQIFLASTPMRKQINTVTLTDVSVDQMWLWCWDSKINLSIHLGGWIWIHGDSNIFIVRFVFLFH